jgi:tricarballylate dehydrogenase
VLGQPDGKAFFVFDESIEEIEDYHRQIGSEYPPFTGRTPAELAIASGIDPEGLTETLEAYNAAASPGQFIPIVPDGLHTVGLALPKSNWARRIDGPVLMAYPLVCTNVFTFGGLRVDADAHVLAADGYQIPGLFAAGETVGLYYSHYVSSSSYLRGLVFGRLSGINAARK